MAVTTLFPALYSGLDTPDSGMTQTETHRIPISAPYEILLSRIPRCVATASSVVDNAFTTITALRGECSLTIDGAAATIIDGQTPGASMQVAFQIAAGGQYEFSPKVIFHSSDAGKTAVFSYTGFMSNADSRYFDAVHDAVGRLEALPPCALLSAATYDGGAFLRGTADDKTVYVTGLRGSVYSENDGHLSFDGATLSLASPGVTPVSAFTDVSFYKTISVYLQVVSGVLALRIAESNEFEEDPITPTITAAEGWLCGAIIVQGDGTGLAGGILPITQARCFSLWNMSVGTTHTHSALPAYVSIGNEVFSAETTAGRLSQYIPAENVWVPLSLDGHSHNGLQNPCGIGSTYLDGSVAGALRLSTNQSTWTAVSMVGHTHDIGGISSTAQAALAAGTMQTYLLTSVTIFPTTTVPTGFQVCDGTAISRTATAGGAALTTAGCPFGTGDGTTTVNVPTLTSPGTGLAYYMYIGATL